MSSARRTAAPRKRPGLVPGGLDHGMGGSDAAQQTPTAPVGASEAIDPQVEEGIKAFLREFEVALSEETELSEENRELIYQDLANALKLETERQASGGDAASVGTFVSAFAENNPNADTRAGFIAQLETALQPFLDRDVSLAAEFGLRCKSEGKERALAWYREQLGENASSAQREVPPVGPQVPVSASSVVKSRSRRLRGPPTS